MIEYIIFGSSGIALAYVYYLKYLEVKNKKWEEEQ